MSDHDEAEQIRKPPEESASPEGEAGEVKAEQSGPADPKDSAMC